MATTVRITETYDLKTEVNKIGLIGIHTPSDALLRKLYPGLMKNHRFVRFKKCDIVGACASVLPADPLQIGVSSGQVAPEDMFNPILMRPCTNTSFATLQSRIQNGTGVGALGSVDKEDWVGGSTGQFNTYYALLSESKRFKKAMPQRGFSMRGLYPIMHTLLSSYGNVTKIGNDVVLGEDGETPVSVPDISDVPYMDNNGVMQTKGGAVVMRGRPVKMPKIPLHYAPENDDTAQTINIPKSYVALIITPPAKLTSFYYRLRVSWVCSFEGVMSTNEIAGFGRYNEIAGLSYRGYESAKSEGANTSDLVDADDVSVTKIMES